MLPTIDAQAESTLFSALKELKDKIGSLANKHQLVGQFWNPNDIRAPFEEELTLSQLASFDPQILIKKKSFTQEKVLALAKAVRTAIDKGRLSLIKNTDTPHEFPIVPSQIAATITKVTANQKHVPASEQLMILGVFTALTLLSSKHDFCGLFEQLLEEFGSKKFIDVFYNEKTAKQKAETAAIIDRCFAQHLPEVHLHWRTALSGAGASLATLLSPYLLTSYTAPENEVVIQICSNLLRGINAAPVKIGSKIIPNHFTLTIEVAPKLYKALKPKKDFVSVQEMSDHLASAFPFFDFSTLFKLLANGTKAR